MTRTTRLQARYDGNGNYLYFVYGYKPEPREETSEPAISASASSFLAGLGWFKRIIFVLTF